MTGALPDGPDPFTKYRALKAIPREHIKSLVQVLRMKVSEVVDPLRYVEREDIEKALGLPEPSEEEINSVTKACQ